MSGRVDWLPPLVLLEDHEGDWDRYCDAVYRFFWEDFVSSRPEFDSRRVGITREPMLRGKEATFWHLISEGSVEEDRPPDIRRCERIRWPRPLIEAASARKVKCWANRRRGQQRILVAVDDFSYLVVLIDRGHYVLLLTAYFVEREQRRRKLRSEWSNSQRTAEGQTPP